MSDWIKKKEEKPTWIKKKEEKKNWITKKEPKKNWITKKDPSDIQDKARTTYRKGGKVKKKSSGKAIRGKGCEIR
jgi:hypothetical protein